MELDKQNNHSSIAEALFMLSSKSTLQNVMCTIYKPFGLIISLDNHQTRGIINVLVQFMYLVFTPMPGESYRRQLGSLLLCLCDVFRALINSLVC